jgi:hypothetical protein
MRRVQEYVYFKKSFFLNFTILMLVLLIGTVAVDVYDASIVPDAWRSQLLFAHCIIVFSNLAAFIYALEAHISTDIYLSIITLVLNLVTFVVRMVQELLYIDLRPAQYAG